MATFVKDVLYPGTYHVPDGKGGRRRIHYSRDDVGRLAERMKEMLEAGLQIPLAAEHQDKAKPLTVDERKAEWVKQLTLGWAADVELAPEGFLTTKVEVPVEEEAKRLPAARFVSPEIVNDFVDGTGRLWPGASITHLAVTPRPVQHKQQPFRAVRMSHVVRLSLDQYAGESMAPPVISKGKAMIFGIRDSGKNGPQRYAVIDNKSAIPVAHFATASEANNFAKIVQTRLSLDDDGSGKEPDAGEKGFDLEELRKVLADDGYGVPEHISEPEEFLRHLHTAALSKKAMIDKLLEDEDDDEESMNGEGMEVDGNGVQPEPVPATSPVLMSLGGHRFQLIRTPEKNGGVRRGKKQAPNAAGADATRLSLAESRAQRLENALLSERRQSIQQRIDRLFTSGRISKPIRDQLVKQSQTVRLSLDAEGQVASNVVLAKVEAYEALPANSTWSAQGMLDGAQPAAPSDGWGADESAGGVAQQVDAFFATLPGAYAKK